MGRIAALFLLLTIASGCATRPGGSGDSPIDTTIAAVRADGAKYDGKYIRIRGLVTRCDAFVCGLVPISPEGKPDWEARRLRFNFWSGAAILNIPDPVMRSRISMPLGFLYRFSEATIVGRYDYTCDSAEDVLAKPASGNLQEITVCTDGGDDLHEATVVSVHRRWPSTAFSAGTDAPKLTPLSADTVAAMTAAYIAAGGIKPWETKDPYRAFIDSNDAESARFCVCLKQDCTGQWPTEPQHLPGNTMNPYTCVQAKHNDGAWHFQPSFDR